MTRREDRLAALVEELLGVDLMPEPLVDEAKEALADRENRVDVAVVEPGGGGIVLTLEDAWAGYAVTATGVPLLHRERVASVLREIASRLEGGLAGTVIREPWDDPFDGHARDPHPDEGWCRRCGQPADRDHGSPR